MTGKHDFKKYISETKPNTLLKLCEYLLVIVSYYKNIEAKINNALHICFRGQNLRSIFDLEKVILALRSKVHFLK
jgi:hypothetical protein